MYVRNLLTAGDYVTLIPFGILVTLQYDDNGKIQSVYNGPDNQSREVTDTLLPTMLSENMMPRSIGIKDGTSWVTGVLYSSSATYSDEGAIPECFQDSLIQEFLAAPEDFSFKAASISSLAAVYRGAVNVRQWLTNAKFDLLPGYAVPYEVDDDKFSDMIEHSVQDTLGFPRLSGYIVYRQGEPAYEPINWKMVNVDKLDEFYDPFGTLYAKVTTKHDGDLTLSWGDVVKHSIYPGTMIILCDGDVVDAFMPTGSSPVRSHSVTCPVCGNIYQVNLDGRTMCSDARCNSRLYGSTNRFLRQLKLPEITHMQYVKFTNEYGNNYTVQNILESDEYAEMPVIASIYNVLRAVIPTEVVPIDSMLLAKITADCHNSESTVEYYLTHPEKITVQDPSAAVFKRWLADPTNVGEVVAALHNPHITIDDNDKRFEGDPTMRSLRILLTGTFQHGSISEVAQILRSYAAKIVYTIDEANTLLIGDISEDVQANWIREMQSRGNTVVYESKFFDAYDIDSDLRENLV